MRKRYEDPRDAAQFHSAWQVVVHASEPEADRYKLLAQAQRAFVKLGVATGGFDLKRFGLSMEVGFRL